MSTQPQDWEKMKAISEPDIFSKRVREVVYEASRVVLAHYRYLQTPVPADGDRTSGQVFELIGNGFVTSGIGGTAASLLQYLDVEAQGSRLRITLIGMGRAGMWIAILSI